MSFENHVCYFCDETYPYPSCFITNYNNLWICEDCEMIIPINIIEQNSECCICLENKILIKLPSCIHKLCFDCCKTIYFGCSTNRPPLHWKNVESSNWPYEFNDDNENDPERIKYNEYCEFENKYFDIGTKSYDELIEIRNSLISVRPEWINTYEFINYENSQFRYHTECVKLDLEWEKYNETKLKGNSICPQCRAK